MVPQAVLAKVPEGLDLEWRGVLALAHLGLFQVLGETGVVFVFVLDRVSTRPAPP